MTHREQTQPGTATQFNESGHVSPLDGMDCHGPSVREKCVVCGAITGNRCPDGNDACHSGSRVD